jgi:hemoglobin/transferrin/lactoferrin receptor protein
MIMSSKTGKTALLALILGSSLFVSAPILAQSSKQVTKSDPTIVVTPTKSKRDIERVPFAVSVISRSEKEQDQAGSIDDMLRTIPNFDSAGGPRRTSEEPSIRGLSDRRIVIKVDGIRRNLRAQYGGRYFIDSNMIDRVEIVRGANSAIDGSGAVGGVIQFFTPTVARELAGSKKNWGVTTQAGYQAVSNEYNYLMSGYTAQNNLDFYGAFSSRDGDDIEAGGDGEIAPSSSRPNNTLLKAGYNFAPNHRAEFRFARYLEQAEVPVSPFQPVSSTNQPSARKSSVTDYSVNYKLAAPDGSPLRNIFDVTSIFYKSFYDVNSVRTIPSTRVDETDFTTAGLDIYNTAKLNYAGLNHSLTTGVEYFENEQTGKRNGAFRPLLGDGADENLGLYVQQETELFGGDLLVTPAARYDHYSLKPGNAALPSNESEEFSPKLGLDYKVNDNWSAYASWASAFRTPTLTELYATGTLFPGNNLVSNPNLKPETAESREIGVRFRKDNVITDYDNLKVNVSVFDNQIEDYIEQIIGATTTQFRNVSKADLKGLEFEVKYRMGQYATGISGGIIRGVNETLDVPLADVPQNKFTAHIERYSKDQSLMVGARGTYYTEQDRIAPNQPLITTTNDGHQFDLYGSWQPELPNGNDGQFKVNFGVDNVTDERYNRHLSFLPEAGRNIKAQAVWKF